jgi:hypothetical protein
MVVVFVWTIQLRIARMPLHRVNTWDTVALVTATPTAESVAVEAVVVVITGTLTGTPIVVVIVTTDVMTVRNVIPTAGIIAVIGVIVAAHLLVAAIPPNTGGAEATPGVLLGEAALPGPETMNLRLLGATAVKPPEAGKGMSHTWLMSFGVRGVRRFFYYSNFVIGVEAQLVSMG